MRVSYNWLKEYVDVALPPQELADAMTMAGIIVDEVEYRGYEIKDVVIAKVISCEKLPKSDHLSVCQVDSGNGVQTVVCGAPNVAAGQTVALALPGSELPGGVKIGLAKLAGIESAGMLCSQKELGLDEEGHQGIWVLPDDLPLGADLVETLKLKDAVLILDLTPNRSDCLGMVNVAREVAAITKTRVQLPLIQYAEKGVDINQMIEVEVEDTDLCPRYLGRMVQNVTIGTSPIWMQQYLLASGMRPINNVVDISNFVLLEMGQPLHTFDYNELSGHKIVVRRARVKEKMVTLDEKERVFTGEELLICDANKPACIAGIMGGINSGISESTKDIFIESAYFNPISIRHTARAFGIPSEASLRFEKGVDMENCDQAAKRACQLLADLCGATVCRGLIDVCKTKKQEKQIVLRKSKVNDLLGTTYSMEEIAAVMHSLAFPVERKQGEDENTIIVSVPVYRQDITLEVDLIEEVARLKGYDNIPLTLPSGSSGQIGKTREQKLLEVLRENCMANGLMGVVNYSFISPNDFSRMNLPAEHALCRVMKIRNALNEEQSIMRTTLIPGILHTVARNLNRRNESLRLFECGARFLPDPHVADVHAQQPQEAHSLCIALSGQDSFGWSGGEAEMDYFYLKGIFEAITSAMNIRGLDFAVPNNAPDYPYLHPGRSAEILNNGKAVGLIGEVHPLVLDRFEVEQKVVILEVDLQTLFDLAISLPQCKDLPKFPAVSRDIALIGKKDVPAAEIQKAILSKGGAYLQKVELFDLYDKPPIPEGCRSLAYALTFQAYDRTLTDEEINAVFNEIVRDLDEKWSLKLR